MRYAACLAKQRRVSKTLKVSRGRLHERPEGFGVDVNPLLASVVGRSQKRTAHVLQPALDLDPAWIAVQDVGARNPSADVVQLAGDSRPPIA